MNREQKEAAIVARITAKDFPESRFLVIGDMLFRIWAKRETQKNQEKIQELHEKSGKFGK